MPITHDYECSACKSLFEALVEVEQREVDCPVCQKGRAVRVYKVFGTMLGKSKGKFPYFDTGAGQTFESPRDRDDYARKTGRFHNRPGPVMGIAGPEEFDRSRHAPRTPDPLYDDEPDPAFIEQAKRDWDDVKFGRIPLEVEEKRVQDVAADFLNADAPDMKPAS